ncbi:MAG: hypothetical protein SOR89_06590 [Ndongobacter sp.]|nr:hypothetical protein [Ndongobacter sp.]
MDKKREKKYTGFGWLIMGSLLIGATAAVKASLPMTLSLAASMALLFAVGAGIGFFLGLFVHEMGHLLFGAIGGFHFQFYELLGLQWRKTGKNKITLHRAALPKGLVGALGRVAMEPSSQVCVRDLKRYFSGGVLGNFLLGGSFFAASLFSNGEGLVCLLLGIASINALLGWMNVQPMRRFGVYSDGDMLRLLRSGQSAEELVQLSRAQGALSEGADPSTLPHVSSLSENPLFAIQQAMVGFLQALDREDYAECTRLIAWIRPEEHPALNLDSISRYALCLVYDSWIVPDEACIARDLAAEDGVLRQARGGWGEIGRVLCYVRRAARPGACSLREAMELLEKTQGHLAEDPDGSVRTVGLRVLQRRKAELARQGRRTAPSTLQRKAR